MFNMKQFQMVILVQVVETFDDRLLKQPENLLTIKIKLYLFVNM